ncbi:MAG: DUF3822 family protein [Ginsengibacter sp.]
MESIFKILPSTVEAQKCTLICEISNEGFSYAIKNDEENNYIAVAIYHFDKNTNAVNHASTIGDEIRQQSLLSENFKNVYIIYSLPESVLIPFSLYSSNENANVLNCIHGDLHKGVSILTDLIAEKGIYNCYRIPIEIISLIKSKFPDATHRHQYTILLKQLPIKGDKMSVIFYPQKIVMVLTKKGKLQFINSFYYRTAEDVSYILLNTCNQFDVQNIPVEVSGLIENSSPLFKEIYKYFNTVYCTELPKGCNYSQEITSQPSHYFSHIFAIDSCE